MEINISPGGKMNFSVPQQNWNGDTVMQTCKFAGQEMMVIQESDEKPDNFELHYLGFVAKGFTGFESAKNQAPAFSKKVLLKMHDMIEPN